MLAFLRMDQRLQLRKPLIHLCRHQQLVLRWKAPSTRHNFRREYHRFQRNLRKHNERRRVKKPLAHRDPQGELVVGLHAVERNSDAGSMLPQVNYATFIPGRLARLVICRLCTF